jgi:YesN/AraC family two-component response regulator
MIVGNKALSIWLLVHVPMAFSFAGEKFNRTLIRSKLYNNMTIYIKNMVCDRCKMAVRAELKKLGLNAISVELGEVILEKDLSASQKERLTDALSAIGFELMADAKAQIIEKIKTTIVELIHHSNHEVKINYSAYIEKKLGRNYNYLSNLFSEVEGSTIEKFIIRQKIERVKELLVYDQLSLSEIAYRMGYSSVAYLSGQFKKVTGLTPSHFKEIKENKRKSLDKI